MQRAPLLLILTALALLGCSSKSPDEELLDATRPLGSWVATLQWTAEAWTANRVPTSFVRNVVDSARDSLDKTREATAKAPIGPGERAPFAVAIAEARAAGSGLLQAVERADRAGAMRQAGRLAGLKKRIEALRRQHGDTSS
ncbi:MAG: hypothetical protein ACJ75H_23410 [Thermoanaerobaculia bacterium]